VVDGAPNVTEQHGAPSVLVTADPVVAELEAAVALRRSGADPKALRRALRRIEELLDRSTSSGSVRGTSRSARSDRRAADIRRVWLAARQARLG
jgi:hypothetical protein